MAERLVKLPKGQLYQIYGELRVVDADQGQWVEESKLLPSPTPAEVRIGSRAYQVRFSCEEGNVDIDLTGYIGTRVQTAIERIPSDRQTERLRVALLMILALVGEA